MVALSMCGACRGEPEAASGLAPGVVARIGRFSLDAAVVAALPGSASERSATIEHDFLLAESRATSSVAAWGAIERGALSRALFEDLTRAAARRGPPTPAELDQARAELWLEVDRPLAYRTVDATVHVPPLQTDDAAYDLADRLARAVAEIGPGPGGAPLVSEFVDRIQSISPEGLPVELVQRAATTADGRRAPVEPRDEVNAPLDPDAARAALPGFTRVGQVSGVAAGRDGYHVLLLTEMVVGRRLEGAALEARLLPAVLAARARPELDAALDKARATTPLRVAPAHASWTRRVWQGQ
jgi:hypothetical protein